MKRILQLIVLIYPMFNFAQTTITIGSDTIENIYGPICIPSNTDPNVNSRILSLYDQSEIIMAGGYSGDILGLSWFKSDTAGYPFTNATFQIFIKTTPYTEFAIPIAFDNEVGDAMLVYSNSTESLSNTTGWINYPLNTPFHWNGSDNIMILTRWSRIGNATGAVKWQSSNTIHNSISSGISVNPNLIYFSSFSIRPNIEIQFAQQPTYDAGVISLDSVRGKCPGNVNIYATIKNYGSSPLDSVRINWDIDGSIQTPVNFIGNLSSSSSSQVFLGSTTFTSGISHSFRAWTSNPNGTVDTVNFNDTISISNVSTGLSGNYTIGSVGADYSSIASAFSSLENNGVCGPTEFLIDTGTYMEKLILHEIPNASAINNVVFRSATNDSSDVMIEWSASSSVDSNYTLKLEGAKYVTFKSLTFARTDTNSYSNVVELSHEASHLRFLNNRFLGPTSVITRDVFGFRSGIFCQGNVGWNDLKINNNYFYGNGTGVWLNGTTAFYSDSLKIENNIFETFFCGPYLQYQNSPLINGNIITRNNLNVPELYYGIFLYHINGRPLVIKNKITTLGGTTGMKISYFNSTTTRGLIANNFIQCGATGPGSGIQIDSESSNLDIFHNNVNYTSPSPLSQCLRVLLGSMSAGDIRIINNIFSNGGGGYSMTIDTSSINAISVSDNNCLFTSGNTLAFLGGNTQSTLADIQNATQRDSNSVSVDPNFASFNDLHTVASALSNAGSALPGLTEDIDGDVRDLVHPDIGADEFTNVGIAIINKEKPFRVYPNPVHETLIIDGANTDELIDEVIIIDIAGRVLLKQYSSGKKISIDVSKLSEGFYLVKVIYSENTQIVNMIKY